jgi:hypothetical protein
MSLLVVLMSAALALVAACSPANPASPNSPSPFVSPAGGPPRVMGTVTAGPVCPVEKSPPDPQCAPRPVAGAVIVATNAAGDEVGRATSEADGSYLLAVGETGPIVITALPVQGLMGVPAPTSVQLDDPSGVLQLDLTYDTGIR